MPKIAMIGAGSLIFCKTLSVDILATEALRGSETCLMNRTEPKLRRMESFLKRVVAENNLPAKITATTDRRAALKNADYVIIMIQVGGLEAFKVDYEVPLKYGVDQRIGDSLGPGGIFRGLRTIPVLADIVRDMEELCPDAVILNYANPMAANCLALGKISRLPFIGLCHGVQTTLDLISGYTDVPKQQIDFLCAGINHMAWFLSLKDKRNGRDLYARDDDNHLVKRMVMAFNAPLRIRSQVAGPEPFESFEVHKQFLTNKRQSLPLFSFRSELTYSQKAKIVSRKTFAKGTHAVI
jgi:alpha-galactosidase